MSWSKCSIFVHVLNKTKKGKIILPIVASIGCRDLKGNSSIFKPGPHNYMYKCDNDLNLLKVLLICPVDGLTWLP